MKNTLLRFNLRAFGEKRESAPRKSLERANALALAVVLSTAGLWACQDQDLDAIRLRRTAGGQTVLWQTTLTQAAVTADTVVFFDTAISAPDTVVLADTIFLQSGNVVLLDTAVVIDTVFTPIGDSIGFDTTETRANVLTTSTLDSGLPQLLRETGLQGQSGAQVRATAVRLALVSPSGRTFEVLDSLRCYALFNGQQVEIADYPATPEDPGATLDLFPTGNPLQGLAEDGAALQYRVEATTTGVVLEDSLSVYVEADFLVEGEI